MVLPRRVQLRRSKGWRMPENTLKVDRSTRWGNPFQHPDRAVMVRQFEEWLPSQPQLVAEAREQLRGRNLACWCPLDGPCHAEVWLKIANG
jgi:hypothetical protein